MPCRPSWSLAGIVGIISCGLLLLVYGESHFNLVGFVVVMTASMLSGLRWTITQVLLQGTPGSSGHGASGGPVEVLLQLTPGKQCSTWAARYNPWVLIKLTPKGAVFSFIFFSKQCSASVVV